MKLCEDDFNQYFEALHGYLPVPWQTELANRVCTGQWPECIDIPTGCGKTAAIDIAVFALAVQASLPAERRTAPMRVFLVVDRRTVVSSAVDRAKRIQSSIINADSGVLKKAADALSTYLPQPDLKPLNVVELRGGIYRDPSWLKALTQPTIVCSTVDQVGSRLLFRGYGVSDAARPIQAAAVACDSLILLDEAHISRPFAVTLKNVRRLQQAKGKSLTGLRPLVSVEMTATPAIETAKRFSVSENELQDNQGRTSQIVRARKHATLLLLDKAKGAKAVETLTSDMARLAHELSSPVSESKSNKQCQRIGLFCNTVGAAKLLYAKLKEQNTERAEVILLIGSMRPIDRESINSRLDCLLKTDRAAIEQKRPLFVVSTQCIEVGADYNFDGIITEAAPVDSLVQRFGRLNRDGKAEYTAAYIVIRGDYVKTDEQLKGLDATFKRVDPVYGNAGSRAWNWLNTVANNSIVDFGVLAMRSSLEKLAGDDGKSGFSLQSICTEQPLCPALLPSHLDLLSQTSSRVHPDPDVSVWLHGTEQKDRSIQICWRADMTPVKIKDGLAFIDCISPSLDDLIHNVGLCAPTIQECMSVPIQRVKAWISALIGNSKAVLDMSADIPTVNEGSENEEIDSKVPFPALIWRGLDDSILMEDLNSLRVGDTLVLPVYVGGWNVLGHIPNACSGANKESNPYAAGAFENGELVIPQGEFRNLVSIDQADASFSIMRRRPIFRFHPALQETEVLLCINAIQGNEKGRLPSQPEWQEIKQSLPASEASSDFNDHRVKDLVFDFYAPNDFSFVITGRNKTNDVSIPEDHYSDNYSHLDHGRTVTLKTHLSSVESMIINVATLLGLDSLLNTLKVAAATHDWGKADERFQALLFGGDYYLSFMAEELYAKSSGLQTNKLSRKFARRECSYPDHFRHEYLSVALLEKAVDFHATVEDPELLKHLVAAHHGFARPWPKRICIDHDPPDVSLEALTGNDLSLTSAERKNLRYYRVDSPIAERYFECTDKFGWWHLAYLEAVLRMSDQLVSANENRKGQIDAESMSSSESLEVVNG